MSIVDAAQYLFTSESVTEGHPDKMCDQISRRDPGRDHPRGSERARRLRDRHHDRPRDGPRRDHDLDLRRLPVVVRETVRDIGYTSADYGFDYLTCGTLVSIKEQSPDIAQGVDAALEVRDDTAPASSSAPATRG